MSTPQSAWGSKLGFILASASSAIGLGAIWKFPFWAGTNGGAAFIIPFLIFTFTIGIVLVMAECAVGRAGRGSAVQAMKTLGGPAFRVFGGLAVLNSYIILTYYCVIGGWCISYLFESVMGNVLNPDTSVLAAQFGGLIGDSTISVFYTFLFLTATCAVVALGVEKGIEKVSKFLMPMLFILMVVLIVRTMLLPGAWDGVKFMFSFNWEQVSVQSLLNAMGFTFFSLSLGAGILVTYGSYLSNKTDIVGSSVWVAVLATQASLLAGLMIIPASFAFGIDPAAGPGLVFITIPMIFQNMPLGAFLAVAFYICLFIAAITSAVSLLEVAVAYLINEWKFSRTKATMVCWGTLFAFATIQALGFSTFADFRVGGMQLLDFSDYVCSNILMPLGGLAIALLAGYCAWPKIKAELSQPIVHSEGLLKGLRLTVTVLAPALVITVLLSGI